MKKRLREHLASNVNGVYGRRNRFQKPKTFLKALTMGELTSAANMLAIFLHSPTWVYSLCEYFTEPMRMLTRRRKTKGSRNLRTYHAGCISNRRSPFSPAPNNHFLHTSSSVRQGSCTVGQRKGVLEIKQNNLAKRVLTQCSSFQCSWTCFICLSGLCETYFQVAQFRVPSSVVLFLVSRILQ